MATAQTFEALAPASAAQSQRLRVGVLLDSLLMPHWAYHIIDELQRLNSIELVVIVSLNNKSPNGHTRRQEQTPKLLRLWRNMDMKFFYSRSAHYDALAPVRFTPVNGAIIVSQPVPMRDNTCTAKTLADLRSMQLDILLDLSSTEPTRELQAIPRHGVLWFGDEESLLADLFWLLYENTPILRNSVNVSSSDTGTGTLAVCYSAADKYSLFRNLNQSCWRRWEPVQRWLNEVRSDDCQGHCNGMITLPGSSHETPGNYECARLLVKVLARLLHDKYVRMLDREHWFVAFRRIRPTNNAAFENDSFTLLHPPSKHFYADPFVIDKAGKTYIFFEDYSYASRKAIISFVTINGDGECSSPDVALEEDYHLAYPCLLEINGQVYLLPETKNHRTIQLYRAVRFPDKWELTNVLLENVQAADSTLLHHGGKFWVFTSGLNTQDPWFNADSELFLFSADSLDGPWEPHPKNPIVTDVRKCRGAGQIQSWNGRLVRPAQDCSSVYGRAVVLNRIDLLSEYGYHESPIAIISPDWLPGNLGTHTFNRSQTYEVLDGRLLVSRFGNGHAEQRFETTRPLHPILQQL